MIKQVPPSVLSMVSSPFLCYLMIVIFALNFCTLDRGVAADEAPAEVANFAHKVSASPITCEASQVFSGERRLYRFDLTNDLGVTVTPGTAQVSCACTAAVFSPTPVAPGATFPLALEVEWPDRHGPASIMATVQLATGATVHALVITINTEVADLIAMDDRTGIIRLEPFTLASAGASIMRETTIERGRYALPWDKVEATMGTSEVTCTLQKLTQDKYQVAFQQRDGLPIGPLTAELTFGFSFEGNVVKHVVRRRVVGSVRGPVAASPAAVFLGALSPGDHRSEIVQVRRTKDSDPQPRVVAIRAQRPHKLISIVPIEQQSALQPASVQINITAPDTPDQSFNDALKGDILLDVALGAVPYTLRVRTIGSLQK